jgi:outer membrane protein TolC
MKKFCVYIFSMVFFTCVNAQVLTLDTCYAKARANFPLIKQYDLIKLSQDLTLSNIARGWIPKIAVGARASYQTDVTKLPFDKNTSVPVSINLPIIGTITQDINIGFDIPQMSKDQYKATIDIVQPIFDGGYSSYQKKLSLAESEIEIQSIEEAMFQIRDKINQIYFGILLIDSYLEQTNTLITEIKRNIDKVNILIENGIVSDFELKNLQVEVLNAEKRDIELQNNRSNLLLMLSAMLGDSLSDDIALETPDLELPLSVKSSRPELLKFEAQEKYMDAMRKMLNVAILPQIGLFVQGGYGRPGLNMLENDFSPYAIGGIQLTWDIAGFYTRSNDLKKINIQKEQIAIQKETFLYNSGLQTIQENSEIKKLQELIDKDEEIVSLRSEIKIAAEKKLDGGLISTSDYLEELTKEQAAKQEKSTHNIQRLIAIANLKNVQGN